MSLDLIQLQSIKAPLAPSHRESNPPDQTTRTNIMRLEYNMAYHVETINQKEGENDSENQSEKIENEKQQKNIKGNQ